MALPKLDLPSYELTLPSNQKKIRFRPFLVKEEKILLMAMESSKDDEILAAIKQIINNCCIDNINIDDLPLFDLEYFFLNLRARSVSEMIDARFKCNNKVEDKECGHILQTQINLLEINMEKDSNHTNKIQLSKDIGIQLKYPKISLMESLKNIDKKDLVKLTFDFIIDSIDFIYDKENVYYAKETDKTELLAFVESLSSEQFNKIEKFFDTIPKLRKVIQKKCEKCGFDHEIVLEGLQSFFG